jgi:hypothetical protein
MQQSASNEDSEELCRQLTLIDVDQALYTLKMSSDNELPKQGKLFLIMIFRILFFL